MNDQTQQSQAQQVNDWKTAIGLLRRVVFSTVLIQTDSGNRGLSGQEMIGMENALQYLQAELTKYDKVKGENQVPEERKSDDVTEAMDKAYAEDGNAEDGNAKPKKQGKGRPKKP